MEAKPNADQRTKNRLREHTLTPVRNDHNELIKAPAVSGLKQTDGPFLLTSCEDNDCNWRGWLPLPQIRNVE